jgi:hypothetical protein
MKVHRNDIKDMLSAPGLVPGCLPVSAITNGVVIYFYTFISSARNARRAATISFKDQKILFPRQKRHTTYLGFTITCSQQSCNSKR